MNQLALEFDAPPADAPRLSRQCAKILDLLRQGPQTNLALNAVCFRYGARIHELRKAGHRIASKRLHEGVWVFDLKE